MPPKKRKISDLTAEDANLLLSAITQFQSVLDEEDQDLPRGLISALSDFRSKLEKTKHTSFSHVDPLTLIQVGIKSKPMFLIENKRTAAIEAGKTEQVGQLSLLAVQELIGLVRKHVSVTNEAGCRILINILLLRVASTMSTDGVDVNIIPEYPISKTLFPGNRSFGGVVDFLLTKVPEKYTSYLLKQPVTAIANPTEEMGPLSSNIFEAKRDNVFTALPQAVIAAASHCSNHNLTHLRGCITSGEQWLFFVYHAAEDGSGLVASADEIALGPQLENLSLILGLLCDWVDHTTDVQQIYFDY